MDEDIDNPALARSLARLRQPETVSVCSCTCLPSKSNFKKQKRKPKESKNKWNWIRKMISRWQQNFSASEDDNHYYDAETMSISNKQKFAIKRNSM